MNQRVKLIVIAVLLLLAGGLFYWNLRPSEQDMLYQQNIAKSKQEQQAGGPTPQPSAPAAAPKASAAAGDGKGSA